MPRANHMDTLNSQTRSPREGARQPSVVEHFSIDGLFKYRSIGFDSDYAATVLIARNGTGKTTLLAALDAFLKNQFSRLINLEFSTIDCKLRSLDHVLRIEKNQIDGLIAAINDPVFVASAKAWEVEPAALLEVIELDLSIIKHSEVMDYPNLYSIYTRSGYNLGQLKGSLDKLAKKIFDDTGLTEIRSEIRQALVGYDIVYLPTYRRIELSLPQVEKRGERKRNLFAQLGISRRGLHNADIQFGLGDIRDRLRALYSDMLFRANQGYGKISANVINDLITGAFRNVSGISRQLPTKESLELFFSRIKDMEREYRRVPYTNIIAAPDLDRLFRGEVDFDARPFLEYYLDQLNVVIQDTRGTEEVVETFIDSCNAYLSGKTDSDETSLDEIADFDWKQIKFHKRSFQVSIESLATKAKVPLESLSSGEKQMISLFARLYLYPGKKLILIDEPELSLSIGWQRKILPDILRAPSCEQIVAITHSPFTFDNELDPYAGALSFRWTKFVPDLFPDSHLADPFEDS
ncbi:AAA family ATPase [Variovorax sp. PBL-E5]|uniref:AAA family ATPase n=1 Tax=Variovorax sp. PBL-E5 TaxID=434014 RepID=UPI001315C5B6|nr:AAA family ATPase [Variovorax sp. PBL-E5]VTU29902.1 cytochrome c biogenesis protein CcmA [Variovorax sp. PBL-E5]